MDGWKFHDTVRAHFLEVDDVIAYNGVVFTILDIAEDESGYRITAQDDEWQETHEFILEDEEVVGLVVPSE